MDLEALSRSSRERIIARIRKSTAGRVPDISVEPTAPVLPVLVPEGDAEPINKLRISMLRMKAELTEVAKTEAIPGHVADVLRTQGAPPDVVMGKDPELLALPWKDAGLRVREPSSVQSEWAGVSRALCAVVETGSVVFISGFENPTNVNFMVKYHFAVIRRDMILASLEDMWEELLPFYDGTRRVRAVNIISGPSATADVEATLTVGAHGPCRFELLVTGGFLDR